jgi:ribonuclease BN (tRNA processing enzyme)
MKITFLGTSDGVPRKGHFCTSTMVEVGEQVYLIDGGAPVAELMLNHDKHPNQLKAFFNTHAHGDHIAGLLPLIMLSGWAFPEARFGMYVPEQRVADAFHAFREALMGKRSGDQPLPDLPKREPRVQFHVYEAGEIYDDGVLKVTAYPTGHCLPRPSYAFMLEAEGKRVFFSGDLAYGLGDYPAVVSQVETDLFVCEMAHFTGEEIAPRLDTCKTKKLIFHHYQANKPPQIEALAASGRFGFPIYMAEDGDCVEV